MTAADARELDRRLDGEVLTQASADFKSTRRPFVARYDDLVPEVITRCASAEDIAAAIDFARRHGLHVAVRGGGHCYAVGRRPPGCSSTSLRWTTSASPTGLPRSVPAHVSEPSTKRCSATT